MICVARIIWNRVGWGKVNNKYRINDIYRILEILKSNLLDINDNVLILWNEATLPVVETKLNKVLENIHDVTAVGFDTWICGSTY
ncbi:MAG TPA: hypothetical protein GXX73_10675 [Clostridium sp.]|uniref:Uncharacterized protein n=1 Tax=Acetivibrio mesophilus TaxID=2487273 RepID=A0A4Q0IAF7_9FIRM|nr:hypothetical protein [Acetivibrio mesophilus]ODM24971.1 hypothetical protein A7W90_01370 [Clostridium sp. Bc-iso-3]RXE60032.1 hypothetical protein EFD62_04565 [Acetivibrio mesophilus]HHV30035.1 hypothetical protein [Clostridium sp.]